MKTMNAIHRIIVKVSRNRFGWSAMNMPVLELTTIGRRSGQPRTVFLTTPLRLGETIVVVASRGGDDHHPSWFLNLRDNSAVQVAVQGGAPREMLARIASPEERSTLWPQVVAEHQNYADYQTKTSRQIPLVLLEPPESPQPDTPADSAGE